MNRSAVCWIGLLGMLGIVGSVPDAAATPEIQITSAEVSWSPDHGTAYLGRSNAEAAHRRFDTVIRDAPTPHGEFGIERTMLWTLTPEDGLVTIAPTDQVSTLMSVAALPVTTVHRLDVTATWTESAGPGGGAGSVVSASATVDVRVVDVDLDGQETKGHDPVDVPDASEVFPGVLLANGRTRLLVRDPGTAEGAYTLRWTNPANNKKLRLREVADGVPPGAWLDFGITRPCSGSWPKVYEVQAAGPWGLADTVDVVLSHSLVSCTDTARLVRLKVDIATDINNDGTIDTADEPIEESGIGEVVRVNDADDSPGGEDDLQYMQVKIEPALTQGVVWFTYDTTKVKIWPTLAQTPGTAIASGSETSPNWNLGTGGMVPDHVYVEGLATTAQGSSINIVLHVKVDGREFTDTIRTTVTDQVGHYAYFAGVRDYLKEYRGPGAAEFKLFEDRVDAPGGTDFDFRLVAVIYEDRKMVVDNAANSGHKDIYEVVADYNDAAIIVNGTFFKWWSGPLPEPWVSRGRLVSAFSVLFPSSQDVKPNDKPEVKGWFGGPLLFSPGSSPGAQFSGAAPNVEPPVHSPLQEGDPFGAVGGLVALYPTYAGYTTVQSIIDHIDLNWNEETTAHIGIDTDERVLFVLAKKNAGSKFSPSISLHQLVEFLVTAGADRVCGLDGGGSVALAHTDRLGASLRVVEAAGRHTHAPVYAISHYVHNYLIFKR